MIRVIWVQVYVFQQINVWASQCTNNCDPLTEVCFWDTVQITRNVTFARARGFARGLIISEGGGVAPVSLVSVHPWMYFMISASETGATPFFGQLLSHEQIRECGRVKLKCLHYTDWFSHLWRVYGMSLFCSCAWSKHEVYGFEMLHNCHYF